ncbi:hypothetical protein B4135_4062 [Caldibacillus debilis]|uniref:Uncharacterized protein n=1 Tax=Caldibacillus debilis TaxID=301148 RepID=A0A150L7P7_9BACI|nr:hypothetical protein B4135_4062 [Caldibacillus debilis]
MFVSTGCGECSASRLIFTDLLGPPRKNSGIQMPFNQKVRDSVFH